MEQGLLSRALKPTPGINIKYAVRAILAKRRDSLPGWPLPPHASTATDPQREVQGGSPYSRGRRAQRQLALPLPPRRQRCFSTPELKLPDWHTTQMWKCGKPYPLFFLLFFVPCHLLSSPFCSLSLLVVTRIRDHIAGSSPLPTTLLVFHFYRCAKGFSADSAASSLADSGRIGFMPLVLEKYSSLISS